MAANTSFLNSLLLGLNPFQGKEKGNHPMPPTTVPP